MALVDYSKRLPDIYPNVELPSDWPSFEWLRSLKEFKSYYNIPELQFNINCLHSKIYYFHKSDPHTLYDFETLPLFSKRFIILSATEILILNYPARKNYLDYTEICKKSLKSFKNLENLPDQVKDYMKYFYRLTDPDARIECKRAYIEFIFSRTLCKDSAKRIADFYN